MITKAQSKRYSRQPSLEHQPRLSSLEKGLLRWTVAERGDKVLDMHVGNGLMLEYLQRNMECEVCGISDEMESVRAARSRLRYADIVYATREDIPWMENSFDSVYLKMDRQRISEAVLHEVFRVLKPGGQMLVGFHTIPAPLRLLSSLQHPERDEDILRGKERARILRMMKDQGLTQITWQPAGLLHSVGIGWKAMTDSVNQG